MNAGGRIRLFSEIRAEAVDDELADLLAAAGFYWFEIGLQSTNPKALKLMNRPTQLKRFVAGAQRLKARGITPSIDLIIGLPGDDLQGFMKQRRFRGRSRPAGRRADLPAVGAPGHRFPKAQS